MPEISPEKLVERLAHGKSVPAVVLLGTDSYLREMCRNQIIEAFGEFFRRNFGHQKPSRTSATKCEAKLRDMRSSAGSCSSKKLFTSGEIWYSSRKTMSLF